LGKEFVSYVQKLFMVLGITPPRLNFLENVVMIVTH